MLGVAFLWTPFPSTLVFLDVSAEDKGVRGVEGAEAAGVALARGVLQALVQIEVVFTLAAVAATVTAEGAFACVHTHMLD